MPTVLLVDDDPTLLKFFGDYLRENGMTVLTAERGKDALRLLFEERPDIAVLDVMMPGMDGWVLAARIREVSNIPLIMLTAKSAETDKLRGFRLGVDDYVTKPFSFAELAARLDAVLSRARGGQPSDRPAFSLGDITVDFDRQLVTRAGEPVSLSPTEFKLLRCLVENSDRALSEDELLQDVWGLEEGSGKGYVRRYIWFLRQKLERDPSNAELIQTVRGFGYRIGS